MVSTSESETTRPVLPAQNLKFTTSAWWSVDPGVEETPSQARISPSNGSSPGPRCRGHRRPARALLGPATGPRSRLRRVFESLVGDSDGCSGRVVVTTGSLPHALRPSESLVRATVTAAQCRRRPGCAGCGTCGRAAAVAVMAGVEAPAASVAWPAYLRASRWARPVYSAPRARRPRRDGGSWRRRSDSEGGLSVGPRVRQACALRPGPRPPVHIWRPG